MIKPPTKMPPAPKIQRKSVKKWMQGTITAYDDGRTPLEGLRSSGNVLLDQDGTVRPRPSLVRFGPQPTGTVLGEIFEFRVNSGLTMTNYMICLQNVAGTTSAYIAKPEDLVWTICTGKTFDNSAKAHYCEVQSKVLIMNGVDSLSYFDTTTATGTPTVVPFTAIGNPVAATITNNGTDSLTTAANFIVYYATTSNSSVGESAGSPSTSQGIKTDRDIWNSSTQSLKITRTSVASEKSWNLYAAQSAPGGSPTLYLIKANIDATVTTFVDDGSYAQDVARPLPTNNSTAGPKASRGTVINGRPWLTGDSSNPFYVWRGGDFGFELDFSPANGGGFSPIGSGTKELPVKVVPYRDGKGTFQITVLCSGTNGHGKRYILSPNSATFGSTTISFYDVIEDSGQDGTDSPDGVILYDNDIHYPSRDGFKSTGTQPSIQNVLSTKRESPTIQTDMRSLNNTAMANSVGLGFEGRLYWALPVSSATNNQIWVKDLDRNGAWMKPLNISADWMTLVNDNSGTTHFVVLSNNIVYELSYAALTADDGVAFPTNGNSGQIPFSDDWREWGKLIKLVFILLRPQGQINFTVAGRTEDSALQTVGSGVFNATSSRAGWSEPKRSWSKPATGWSRIVAVPVSFNDATQEVEVEVDEELQWFSYGWNTNQPGVDYNLSDVVAEFVNVGIKDLGA